MKEELKIQVHECSGWYICQVDGDILKVDAWTKLPDSPYMMVHAVNDPENESTGWIVDYENKEMEPGIYVSKEEAEQAQKEAKERKEEAYKELLQKNVELVKSIRPFLLTEVINAAYPGAKLLMGWQTKLYSEKVRAIAILKDGGLSFVRDHKQTFIPLSSIDYYEQKDDNMLSVVTKSGMEYCYEDNASLRDALNLLASLHLIK